MKAQRLRFQYRLTPAAVTLGHRDIVNAWIAAVSNAGYQVAYSEGKRPAPQVSLGAPLPQAVTSDCEFVDVHLSEAVDPATVLGAVASGLPDGIEAVSVAETSVGGPSLQTLVKWAEYEVQVPRNGITSQDAEASVAALLSSEHLPIEHRKENKVKRFDLRPLVLSLKIECVDNDFLTLRMRLRAEPEATARADQTVAALGLPPPSRIHRTMLHLADIPAAITAFRRQGEPDAP